MPNGIVGEPAIPPDQHVNENRCDEVEDAGHILTEEGTSQRGSEVCSGI